MTDTKAARRPLALITGAGGGMGAACARMLGRRYPLILTELSPEAMANVTAPLRLDGVEIVGEVAGDITQPETRTKIAALLEGQSGLDALVHTAGISPSMGSWDKVLRINLCATLDLLDMVEGHLAPGASGVLIASLAAQTFVPSAEIDAMLRTVTSANALAVLEEMVRATADDDAPLPLSGAAYAISKYFVKRLCEWRAPQWGTLGARITSISPGLISTSMGRMEADGNDAAKGLAEMAPAGRWGTALDIAAATEFLLSDNASFISGCDLRVDGGLAARLKG